MPLMYLISLEFIVEKDIYHFPNHLGSGGRIKNEFDSFAKLINSLLKKKKSYFISETSTKFLLRHQQFHISVKAKGGFQDG